MMESIPILTTIVVISIVILALALVYFGIQTVEQGVEIPVERFGRYTRTLKPGLHLIVPFVDQLKKPVSMKEVVLDVESQEIITKDNATVTVDAVCFYHVFDAAKSAYAVESIDDALRNLVITNVRTVLGAMDLDQSLSGRDKINNQLLSVIDNATEIWGLKVTRVEIKDIKLQEDIRDAMSKQLTSEREKRAQILKAEGERQGEILRAEGLKMSSILEAEGRREAAFKDAEAREREAEAEAKATAMMSKSIAEGDVSAIQYFVAQKYVESLKDIASAENGKVIFMPLDASGVLGAVGGVKELLDSVGLHGNAIKPKSASSSSVATTGSTSSSSSSSSGSSSSSSSTSPSGDGTS